jgi:carboxyl-terminal processing protease
VLQEVPEEVKGRVEAVAEATLRGHLKAQGTEEAGSQSYIPPDPKNDKALNLADDLLRGIAIDTAFPPNPNRTVPN